MCHSTPLFRHESLRVPTASLSPALKTSLFMSVIPCSFCVVPRLGLGSAGADVGSSVIAEKIVSLCRGYARSLTVELGICLEGR